jgi:hypothetical protein
MKYVLESSSIAYAKRSGASTQHEEDEQQRNGHADEPKEDPADLAGTEGARVMFGFEFHAPEYSQCECHRVFLLGATLRMEGRHFLRCTMQENRAIGMVSTTAGSSAIRGSSKIPPRERLAIQAIREACWLKAGGSRRRGGTMLAKAGAMNESPLRVPRQKLQGIPIGPLKTEPASSTRGLHAAPETSRQGAQQPEALIGATGK